METLFSLAHGCYATPVTDFMNNPIAQELKKENEYFGDDSDKRLYFDLRQSNGYTEEFEKPSRNDSKMSITIENKNSLTKKMRLRVWGYTNKEHIYLLQNGSLNLKHKPYMLKSQYEELEA